MLKDEMKKIKSGKPELKQFGLTVGIFFLVLGTLLFALGKENYPAFWIAGGFLTFTGRVFPNLLKPLQKVWMSLALVLGWFMTRVILTVFFFLVLTPISILGRLFGKKFLNSTHGPLNSSYWIERDVPDEGRGTYERQY